MQIIQIIRSIAATGTFIIILAHSTYLLQLGLLLRNVRYVLICDSRSIRFIVSDIVVIVSCWSSFTVWAPAELLFDAKTEAVRIVRWADLVCEVGVSTVWILARISWSRGLSRSGRRRWSSSLLTLLSCSCEGVMCRYLLVGKLSHWSRLFMLTGRGMILGSWCCLFFFLCHLDIIKFFKPG